MLSPRLNDCPECADIPSLLKKIDCKLAELGNNLYNNISYMLNKPVPADDILQLIGYRRILTHKYCNPNYVHKYSVKMIASRVIRLTLGCVSRCNEPERCLEEPCDIVIVPNPSTTSTSSTSTSTTSTTTTAVPTTTTTSSSSSTSTTTSTSTSSTTSTTSSTSSTSSTTTTSTTLSPAECAALILDDGDVYTYDVNTNISVNRGAFVLSNDIANTATKMWLMSSFIEEYNITVFPWASAFNRNITYNTQLASSNGLCAKDNVTLITTNSLVGFPHPIISLDISGSTAVETIIGYLPMNTFVTGDFIYTTTGKLIITISVAIGGGGPYIVQYDYATMNLEVQTTIPFYNAFGLIEANNNLYVLRGTGEVYQVDLNYPYGLTLVQNTGLTTTAGASQTPNCCNVNLIPQSSSTTTTSSSSTTSTTSTSTSSTTSTTTTLAPSGFNTIYTHFESLTPSTTTTSTTTVGPIFGIGDMVGTSNQSPFFRTYNVTLSEISQFPSVGVTADYGINPSDNCQYSIAAAGNFSPLQIKVSSDYANSYSIPSGAGSGFILETILSKNGKYMYIESGAVISRSDNFGTSFSVKSLPVPFTTILQSSISWNGQYVIILGQNVDVDVDISVLLSTDYGITFTNITLNIFPSQSAANASRPQGAAVSGNGSYMMVVSAFGNSYRSVNFGVTWQIMNIVSQDFNEDLKLSYDGRYGIVSAMNNRVITTNDFGVTWTTNTYSSFILKTDISNSGQYMLATLISGNTTLISSNYGTSWTPYNDTNKNFLSFLN